MLSPPACSTSTSVSPESRSLAEASTWSTWASFSSVMAPVLSPAGTSRGMSETSRTAAPDAEARRTALSSRSSAPGRVPVATVMRGSPASGSRESPAGASATGTVEACSSSDATEPSRWRRRAPPFAAPRTSSVAPNSSAAACRPSPNDSAKRTWALCTSPAGMVFAASASQVRACSRRSSSYARSGATALLMVPSEGSTITTRSAAPVARARRVPRASASAPASVAV